MVIGAAMRSSHSKPGNLTPLGLSIKIKMAAQALTRVSPADFDQQSLT